MAAVTKVLFSNPPWFEVEPGTNRLRKGVRAGSRWPNTYYASSMPDWFVFGHYVPYPFFMGYAATYVARHTGAESTLRDSVALHESYDTYIAYLRLSMLTPLRGRPFITCTFFTIFRPLPLSHL